ncbi:peptidylprolyl isomerase [Nitrincola sp.]|uniref:peptidylprolyl isomerase n=1 Tax=Nitrincola sp. TaxID=1926584 RepID=UPI003A8DB5D5
MKKVSIFVILLTLLLPIQAVAQEPSVQIRMITSQGNIELALDPVNAPVTVENFLAYVDSGFYEGLTFHRVIPNFMIQGGGLDVELKKQDTRSAIINESANGLSNRRGTIAMARTNDPDSATSQFFINVANNENLDGHPLRAGYTVFGEVTAGLDVVFGIARVPTRSRGGLQNVPITPVIIEKVERILPTE